VAELVGNGGRLSRAGQGVAAQRDDCSLHCCQSVPSSGEG
jgi:hypothetical protein